MFLSRTIQRLSRASNSVLQCRMPVQIKPALPLAGRSQASYVAFWVQGIRAVDRAVGACPVPAFSGRTMSRTRRYIQIQLSDKQIAQVVQEAGDGGIRSLLSARLDEGGVRKSLTELIHDPLMNEPGISRSVMRSWIVFAAFTPVGTERRITDVARELEMTPSTTHRYIATLTALGLLEQTVNSQYRIAVMNAKS